VNPDGDQFDPRSGMVRFEEVSFFPESVLEVSIVADGDAQIAHSISGTAAEVFRGVVLSMVRFNPFKAAAAVYRRGGRMNDTGLDLPKGDCVGVAARRQAVSGE